MKKRDIPQSAEFKMPHLYKDDLGRIESIIQTDLKARDYKILTEEYEFDNLDEIPEDIKSSGNVTITCYDPYISIDFGMTSARIYTSASTMNAKGAYSDIVKIIKNRERKILYHLVNLSPITLPLVFTASLALIFIGFKLAQYRTDFVLVGIFILILSMLLFRAAWLLTVKRFSLIDFRPKTLSPNFFERNRDRILVGVIVAVVTALISKLV